MPLTLHTNFPYDSHAMTSMDASVAAHSSVRISVTMASGDRVPNTHARASADSILLESTHRESTTGIFSHTSFEKLRQAA